MHLDKSEKHDIFRCVVPHEQSGKGSLLARKRKARQSRQVRHDDIFAEVAALLFAGQSSSTKLQPKCPHCGRSDFANWAACKLHVKRCHAGPHPRRALNTRINSGEMRSGERKLPILQFWTVTDHGLFLPWYCSTLRLGGFVNFPNIVWELKRRRLPQYVFAKSVRIDKTRFSRAMSGIVELTEIERERIAQALGYPEAWLFSRPTPPRQELLR
jgi:hypothetical protein